MSYEPDPPFDWIYSQGDDDWMHTDSDFIDHNDDDGDVDDGDDYEDVLCPVCYHYDGMHTQTEIVKCHPAAHPERIYSVVRMHFRCTGCDYRWYRQSDEGITDCECEGD